MFQLVTYFDAFILTTLKFTTGRVRHVTPLHLGPMKIIETKQHDLKAIPTCILRHRIHGWK